MTTLKQAAESKACVDRLSKMTPQAAVIQFAADHGLITSKRSAQLNQIDWAEDFSPFVSPDDGLVTNADQLRLMPSGVFIAFIEVDPPTVTTTDHTRLPMGKRHLIHAMIHLDNGFAAGTGSHQALGIGAGDGWEVVDLATKLNWVPCANGFEAINAVPLGVNKSRPLRIRYRQMFTDIKDFIDLGLSRGVAIRNAITENDRLGDKKLDKFDVVADQILPADQPIEILKITDWDTVKKDYATLPSDLSMLLMLAYRKRFVDRKISNYGIACTKDSNKPIVPKSVGSTDLTSDYDITVGITGGDISGAELDVIQLFNNDVRLSFGKQPGTIFDTNLYAKDFLALNKDDQRLTIPEVGAAMYAMLVEGQDVGALVKQRRYMPNAEWHTFLDTLLKNVGALNSAAVDVTRHRYETADAQYLLNIHELLQEFDERAKDTKTYGIAAKDYADAKAAVDKSITQSVLSPEEQAFVKNSANQEMATAQLMLRYRALRWEHNYPDLVLWATNDLYVRKMKEIRQYQQKIGAKGNPAAGDVRVADLISSAIFFASEAYLSEGALRHVVDGVQAANANPKLTEAEKKQVAGNALISLTIEQLLQSINEQFGDFLKDFAHYGDSPEFLFRGAKYIQRLLEATDILSKKKQQGSESEKTALKNLDLKVTEMIFVKPDGKPVGKPVAEILNRLNDPKEGLVAVRKGKKCFINDAERNKYCGDELFAFFGVNSGTGLKDRIKKMVLNFNAQVRSGLTAEPTTKDVQAYFTALQG